MKPQAEYQLGGTTRTKNRRLILLGTPIALAIVAILVAHRTTLGVVMLNQTAPFLLPSSQLVRNLDSKDTGLVRESLGILAKRRDSSAVDRVIGLLQGPDDYVWLNAAHYLGSAGHAEAVPYLIKGFRHTASRSDSEGLAHLQRITGQTFPADFRTWSNWWAQTHADTVFDFDSHLGPIARR